MGDLKYAFWNGQVWQTHTVDSAEDVGQYCTLALDRNGFPYIGYYDATRQSLKVARWVDGSWKLEFVDTAADAGPYASLALDPLNGRPHAAAASVTAGPGRATRVEGPLPSLMTDH